MPKRVRLLTLQTFSTTGGIQKMTRTLSYSLYQLARQHQWYFSCWSLYDSQDTLQEQYLPPLYFKGFGNKKLKFIIDNLKISHNTDVLILTHINLAVIGVLTKLINPKSQVYLIAHGIEVWRPLNIIQKHLLKISTRILCVSSFTQQQIQQLHQITPPKTQVLNNALDPFMILPDIFCKPDYLLERYQLRKNHQVLFTLTRLASTEQYKGYEQVIKAIAKLKGTHPEIKYMLAGKYDAVEQQRIFQLIEQYGAGDQVIVTGFIKDEELTDHFLLADLFVLPSKKEGFGLVFIEALACGLPVICGNADGSTDAIMHGELGTSINADSVEDLEQAIAKFLNQHLTMTDKEDLQKKCLQNFNENQYREQLYQILNEPAGT